MNVQQIEEEALRLSKKERARIALTLIESIDKIEPEFSEEELEKLWLDEAEDRYNEFKKGNIKADNLKAFIKEEISRYK